MRYLFLLPLSLFLIGCENKLDKLTEVELYDQAQDLYKRKKYSLAAEFFEHYETKFPINHNIAEALFSRAVCYYANGSYEMAIAAFEMFVSKYPADARAAQAHRYLFFCYYNQVTRYDRDYAIIERAIYAGNTYKEFYIEDEQFMIAYKLVQDYAVFCKLKVVHTALDQDPKLWCASLWAASGLINEHPDHNLSAEGYFRIIELFLAQNEDGLRKDALKILSAMAKHHSGSDWYQKASDLIEKECEAEDSVTDIDEE